MKEKLGLFKEQRKNAASLTDELQKFTTESKKSIEEMNNKLVEESTQQNKELHDKTAEYEFILKHQIDLLSKNKEISAKKEHQDELFDQQVQKLSTEYEGQIGAFEKKVKANVKKIQDLSGGNVIKIYLKNDKFR